MSADVLFLVLVLPQLENRLVWCTASVLIKICWILHCAWHIIHNAVLHGLDCTLQFFLFIFALFKHNVFCMVLKGYEIFPVVLFYREKCLYLQVIYAVMLVGLPLRTWISHKWMELSKIPGLQILLEMVGG